MVPKVEVNHHMQINQYSDKFLASSVTKIARNFFYLLM
jgi:hypothetical protein